MLTRSTNLDQDILLGQRGAVGSWEQVVAQVWKIDNGRLEDEESRQLNNTTTTSQGGSATLILELKWPGDEEPMIEHAHATFKMYSQSSLISASNGDCGVSLASLVAKCESAMSISHHADTDCLALCSQNVTLTPTRQV